MKNIYYEMSIVKPGQKIGQGVSNGHNRIILGYALVSKDNKIFKG